MFNLYKEMMESGGRLTFKNFSEMGWVASGQFFNVILNFVLIKQLSALGAEGYGIYALVLTLSILSGSLLYGPGMQAFIRFYYTYFEKGISRFYVFIMYRFILLSGGALLLLGIFVLGIDYSGLIDISLPVILCAVFIIVSRTDEFLSVSLNLIRKRKQNTILQSSGRLLSILLLYVLADKLNVEIVLSVFIVTALLFAIIKFIIFNKYGINRDEKEASDLTGLKLEIRKALTSYAYPFIIWGIAGWVQLNGEKWIIASYLSVADVGIYALMMNLVTAFIIIPYNIINDFSTPIIFQNFSDLKNSKKVKSGFLIIRIIIAVVFAASIFTSVITYFFGAYIIQLVSSETFTLYSYLLPLLCIGTGLFYAGQAMCNTGLALNRPKKYILPKIITGIVSVILNILLLVNFGLIGIAYASILTGVFYSVYIWIENQSLSGEF